jgi:DNA-binding XRE family transcriptional regulator
MMANTRFEELRIKAGLTITQLAKEADVSRALIEKIQKNQRIREPLAARVCNVLSRHLGYEVTYQELEIPTVR